MREPRRGGAMSFRPSRSVWFGLVLILLGAGGAIVLPRIYRTALLGSGYMAQTLCGGIFISGRDPKSLLDQDLTGKGLELLVLFQPEIDLKAKRVSASAFGIGRQKAIFRDGLGCTLLDGRSEAELKAEAASLPPLPTPINEDALWPEGERVALDALPKGIDGAALEQAIDSVFAEPDPAHPRRTRALVVVQGGRIVAERYAPGFNAAMPMIGWSISKSAVNALIGLRVKDGKLALTDTALIPEWRDQGDPRRAITVDELMRMTSGLAFDESYGDT
ncbi:MAG TPA: serine hydrolase, partial [Methyloceanibacter sp.]|nr:serine hydrolase [Methyloceanibacter sp.]